MKTIIMLVIGLCSFLLLTGSAAALLVMTADHFKFDRFVYAVGFALFGWVAIVCFAAAISPNSQ
jgi:di/tricarboxylate transporter